MLSKGRRNLDVFVVEYPGYTDRPGVPTEFSVSADVCTAGHFDSVEEMYAIAERQ